MGSRYGICGVKAYGILEVTHRGKKVLVPLCDKHREEVEGAAQR